jgi:hypothetical protein
MEITIAKPLIAGRQEARIFWRDLQHDSRNQAYVDQAPRSVVDVGLEPVATVIAVPAAAIEIKANPVRYHVDVAFAAGDDDDIRRGGKTNGRRHADIDGDAHVLRRCKRRAKQGKNSNDREKTCSHDAKSPSSVEDRQKSSANPFPHSNTSATTSGDRKRSSQIGSTIEGFEHREFDFNQ